MKAAAAWIPEPTYLGPIPPTNFPYWDLTVA
jgi:hypothetical protein